MSSTRHRSNSERGMTLAELLVTIALVSVISIALMDMVQSFYKDNAYLVEETSALASARGGVNAAVKAMREASYGDDGSYPIVSVGTSTITFFADTDQDAAVEKIHVYLLNGVLYQTVTHSAGTPPTYPAAAAATTTIATDVRNTAASPLFTYFDSSGAQLSATSTNVSAISSVQVQLLVDLNPNRAPNVYLLSQSVTLRNLQK